MADWSFLKRGDRLELDGQLWRVEFIKTENESTRDVESVVLLDIVEGRSCNLSADDLNRSYDEGQLTLRNPHDHPEDVRPIETDELPLDAKVRLFYTRAFDEHQPKKSVAALQTFISEIYPKANFPHRRPSPGSVRRWVNERGAPGQRLPCQMRGRYRRGPQGIRAPAEAVEIIENALDRYFGGW